MNQRFDTSPVRLLAAHQFFDADNDGRQQRGHTDVDQRSRPVHARESSDARRWRPCEPSLDVLLRNVQRKLARGETQQERSSAEVG